jgi:hypothetical protein
VIRQWSRSQWLLRGVIVLGPLVALLATIPAGATPAWWLMLLVAGIASVFAVYPDSPAGTGAYFLVVVWWGLGLRDGLHPAALVAATGLLASHLAATVANYGPSTVALDPAVLRRWTVRGLLVLPAAVLAWVVAEAALDQPEPRFLWATGLAGLLVALVAANLLYVREPD